jgi:hypothetical protein
MRLDVFIAVNVKFMAFWDLGPYSLANKLMFQKKVLPPFSW